MPSGDHNLAAVTDRPGKTRQMLARLPRTALW
jgi:hypothetical protein